MQSFPVLDPIPLPAPIWLIKLLHIVTLALHFVAVEMLLGGLLIAVLLSLFRKSPHASVTARALAKRLTVVMTYVINLGVPPLLFAQVLYGRALYTSSVLIGVYWISIVAVLMLTYWLVRNGPTGRTNPGEFGVPGFHPGLFSFAPSGRMRGAKTRFVLSHPFAIKLRMDGAYS